MSNLFGKGKNKLRAENRSLPTLSSRLIIGGLVILIGSGLTAG